MESRTHRIFLNAALLAGLLAAPALHADEADADTSVAEDAAAAGTTGEAAPADLLNPQGEAPLIEPDVARREVKEVQIDSENIEIGAYAGMLSIEDFGSNSLVGGMIAWHFTEDLFLQGHYYQSEAGLSSYEVLSGSARLLKDRSYSAYDLSVGYNLFPGEAFIGRKRAYNTAFYLLAGIGSTDFGGDNRFTLNVGVGYRLLLTDWLAWHIGFRDHVFASDITGEDKNTNNMELNAGLTTFF